jgi:hypothetical protein
MLCCIGEIALLIFGIVTLVKGELKVGGGRVVRGVPARLCGLILFIPLLLGEGFEVVYGFRLGLEKGMQGQQMGPEDIKEMTPTFLIVHAIAVAVPLLLIVVIALTQAQSETTFRDRFEDDDRPRRRRRRDDDEDDDDRPRSRRDEEEEEDRPRRRRRDDEDEETDERVFGK